MDLQIFSFSPKKSSNFGLVMRFSQGVFSLVLVAALCLVVAFTNLSIADLFACILAFIPTGWMILSVSRSQSFLHALVFDEVASGREREREM